MIRSMIVMMIVFGVLACKGQENDQMKSQQTQTTKESKEMTVAVMKTNMSELL